MPNPRKVRVFLGNLEMSSWHCSCQQEKGTFSHVNFFLSSMSCWNNDYVFFVPLIHSWRKFDFSLVNDRKHTVSKTTTPDFAPVCKEPWRVNVLKQTKFTYDFEKGIWNYTFRTFEVASRYWVNLHGIRNTLTYRRHLRDECNYCGPSCAILLLEVHDANYWYDASSVFLSLKHYKNNLSSHSQQISFLQMKCHGVQIKNTFHPLNTTTFRQHLSPFAVILA